VTNRPHRTAHEATPLPQYALLAASRIALKLRATGPSTQRVWDEGPHLARARPHGFD